MRIKRLIKEYNLSETFLSCCVNNNLTSSTNIVDYYLFHGSFQKLKKIDSETLHELEYVVKCSFNSHENSDISFDLISIKNKFGMTKRAFNICYYNGLTNAKLLLQWWDKFSDFKKLRNSGELTAQELLSLVEKIKSQDSFIGYLEEKVLYLNKFLYNKELSEIVENKNIQNLNSLLIAFFTTNTFKPIFFAKNKSSFDAIDLLKRVFAEDSDEVEFFFRNNFNNIVDVKIKLIQALIEKQIINLSVRSRNGLKIIVGEELNIIKILLNSFTIRDVLHIRNIGTKSKIDLDNFFKEINRLYFNTIIDSNDSMEDLLSINFNLQNLDEKWQDQLENKELDFFEFIINNYEKFLSDFECSVFNMTPRSILSTKLKISRERVRQKTLLAEDQIIKVIDEIHRTLLEYINYNDFNLEETFVFLSNTKFFNYSSKINSKVFNELISLSVKNNDSKLKLIQLKSFFSNYEQILTKEDSHRLYKSLFIDNYIIVTQDFNLTNISKIVFEIAKDLIIDNQDINILDLSDNVSSNEICLILKSSLGDQFGIIKYEKNIYIFKQTNKMYCYIALKIFEKNTDLDKIYSYIIHNVGFNKKPEKTSIRGTLISDKNLFFSIGKTSTYGLSEWNKTDIYATNSIKDECILLLNNSDIPLHSNQIYNMLQIRRTEVPLRSIKVILDMEKDIFDNSQGFYWLKDSINSIELPVNHKTASSKLNQFIKKIDLNNFWCETKILINYLLKYEIPTYQIDYIIDHYLISFQGKSTLKLELDFLSLLKEIDHKADVKDFLIEKYMQLDVHKRSDFRNKLQTVLQKKSDQLITRPIVNKIIQFYI